MTAPFILASAVFRPYQHLYQNVASVINDAVALFIAIICMSLETNEVYVASKENITAARLAEEHGSAHVSLGVQIFLCIILCLPVFGQLVLLGIDLRCSHVLDKLLYDENEGNEMTAM